MGPVLSLMNKAICVTCEIAASRAFIWVSMLPMQGVDSEAALDLEKSCFICHCFFYFIRKILCQTSNIFQMRHLPLDICPGVDYAI